MDWLYKNDNYIPLKDKKNYIDKSILSILGILSKIRQEDKSMMRGLYKISPPLKFIFTVVIILFLSLTRSFPYILLIDSLILLGLSFISLKDLKKILTIICIVFVFSVILLVPSMLFGNIYNSFMIIFKILGSVTLLNILSYTTKWRHITGSFKIFFIPDIFILILDMTIKYIVILGDFSINMLYALKLRSVGKDKSKHVSLSNLIGVLFLKSKEMSEETYYAMECRGFTGEYTTKLKLNFIFLDFVYIFINLIVILLFFYFRKG